MKFTIYTLLLFMFMACTPEPEDDLLPETDTDTVSSEKSLILQVTRDLEVYKDFAYNDDNELIQEREYDLSGNLRFTWSYMYQGDKLIVTQITAPSNESEIYEYYNIDPLISRRDRLDGDGNLIEYYLYKYEDSEACYYYNGTRINADGELLSQRKLTFPTSNCSYKSATFGPDNLEQFNSTITLDGKNGYRNGLRLPILPIAPGNVTQFDFISVNAAAEAKTFTSSFEYNNFDYPIKETRSYTYGKVEEYTFLYK